MAQPGSKQGSLLRRLGVSDKAPLDTDCTKQLLSPQSASTTLLSPQSESTTTTAANTEADAESVGDDVTHSELGSPADELRRSGALSVDAIAGVSVPALDDGRMNVRFLVTCNAVGPGDTLLLVGSSEELGEWRPERGVRLTTSPSTFPLFEVSVPLSEGLVEWKLVIRHQDGYVEWEEGEEREVMVFSHAEPGSICLRVRFGDMEASSFSDDAAAAPVLQLQECLIMG